MFNLVKIATYKEEVLLEKFSSKNARGYLLNNF